MNGRHLILEELCTHVAQLFTHRATKIQAQKHCRLRRQSSVESAFETQARHTRLSTRCSFQHQYRIELHNQTAIKNQKA